MLRYYPLFTQYFTAKMRRLTIILSTLLLSNIATAQITLESYTNEVLAYSITRNQASLSIEGEMWELRRIRREQLPEIGFDRSASVDFGHQGTGRAWSWETRLEARQIIYNGGAIRAQREAQEQEVEIEQLAYAMSIRAIRLEAEEAYWRLSYANEYLKSMEYYRDIIDTLYGVVERRFDEGYSAKGDLLQIKSRLSDAEYQLATAKEAYDIALHNFNSLCNRTIDKEIVLSESILTIALMPTRSDIDELIASHPEHHIAELRAEQGRWRVKGVNAEYLPHIDIRTYATLQPELPHTRKSGLELGGGAMIGISSTLFHFGERRNAVNSAKSKQLVLELEIEAVSDEIELAEEDSWTELTRTHERVVSQTKSLDIASENLEISTYAYNEGESSILDVMQAQISWLQTYKNYLAAHYDYAVACAKYRYITGD